MHTFMCNACMADAVLGEVSKRLGASLHCLSVFDAVRGKLYIAYAASTI